MLFTDEAYLSTKSIFIPLFLGEATLWSCLAYHRDDKTI